MTLKNDYTDFYSSFGRNICRGNRLNQLLREFREGVSPREDDIVTGFSGSSLACKRFAGRIIGEDGHIQGPPSVVIMREQDVRESNPSLVEVEYTKEWFQEHPKILDALLTVPMPYASFEEKLRSVLTFEDENEFVVTDIHKAKLPTDVKINVYIGPKELEEMGIRTPMYGATHPWFVKAVDRVIPRIKWKIKRELPLNVTAEVKIYSCHDTMNLFDEDRSACVEHETFYIDSRK